MNQYQWIRGTVIRGSGRGTQLGAPTANIKLDDLANSPAHGIYAGWAHIDFEPQLWPAAIHAGPRPAIGDPRVTVEIHLIDFPGGNLYDKRLMFICAKRLRDVAKFDTMKELIEAMQADIQAARAYCKDHSPPHLS